MFDGLAINNDAYAETISITTKSMRHSGRKSRELSIFYGFWYFASLQPE